MKFGFDTKSWHKTRWAQIVPKKLCKALEAISGSGFTGFETMHANVAPFFKKKSEFINILSETNLQLAAIHVWGNFYTARRGIHPKSWWRRVNSLKPLPSILKFASAVGCGCLMVDGGPERAEGAREKDYASMAKGLNKIGRMCNDFGIEASFHPFGRNQIISSKDKLQKLCRLTDPNLLHLTIDLAHSTRNKIDPATIISEFKERINHIHLRDYTEDGRIVGIGDGNIDLKGIYNLLRSNGYKDWAVVQHGSGALEYGHNTPNQSVIKAGKYIDEHLLNPEPTCEGEAFH